MTPKNKNIVPLMGITLFTIIIIIVAVMTFAFLGQRSEIDMLKHQIDNMNVSDEYEQGWLDCISYLENDIRGPQNSTNIVIQPIDKRSAPKFTIYNIGYLINPDGTVTYIRIPDNPFTRYIWHNPDRIYPEEVQI